MIYIDNLKKEINTRTLFEIKKLTIGEDNKIGLIGDNGAGKTSFFKILICQDTDYSGKIDVQIKIAHLLNDDEEEKFSHDNYVKAKLNKEGKFSPGEYQRLKLAKLLSNEQSFLLIDEPTSHLDIKQKKNLAESLRNRDKGYILISHDRDFINQTCDKIFELAHGELEVFNGDYTFYLDERVKRKKFLQKEYEGYVNEKKRLTGIANDIKAQTLKVRTTPKRMGNSEARLHKMGGQKAKKNIDNNIKAIKSRIDHLDVKEKPKDIKEVKINVIESLELTAKNPIEVKDLNLIVNDKILLSNANFKIKKGKKVALIGKNGSGKSTLLKELIKNDNENIKISNNVIFGFLDQEQDILNKDKTILENIQVNSSYQESFIRINLDGFGFKGDTVYKKVSTLSGGEKVRVAICKLLLSDNNIIILDEPTNYLDIKCMESLENALKNTNKTLLIVSHDRKFISNICNYILEIENNEIHKFDGSYDEYMNFKSKPKASKNEKANKEKIMLLENKLSEVISLLSFETNLEKKELLEGEYIDLLNKLKALK